MSLLNYAVPQKKQIIIKLFSSRNSYKRLIISWLCIHNLRKPKILTEIKVWLKMWQMEILHSSDLVSDFYGFSPR